MLEINWNSGVADPVKLADYIEATLSLDDDRSCDEFNYAHFVDLIREEPNGDVPDDDSEPIDDMAHFLSGQGADEAKHYFENAVSLIENRSLWLEHLYPFSVENGAVQLQYEPAADNGMPYTFLLACSLHQALHPSQALTIQFEQVCKEGLRTLFNESAEVFLFSQFSQDRAELGRSAREAVQSLAEKLNAKVKNEEDIPNQPNEFGIDIVAIDRLGDSVGYPFFAFAQCTIAQDWSRKKGEASASNALIAYVDLAVQHSNLIFIPHFLRENADRWSARPDETVGCIIFDRLRICRMLERLKEFKNSNPLETLNSVLKEFSEKFFIRSLQ